MTCNALYISIQIAMSVQLAQMIVMALMVNAQTQKDHLPVVVMKDLMVMERHVQV